jgi:hypothetical protein
LPTSAATRPGRALVVAGDHHRLDAGLRHASHRVRGVVLDLVTDPDLRCLHVDDDHPQVGAAGRMHRQGELASVYLEQLTASRNLVEAYQEQFNVGDRSLLDVLDAQNTRYNLQVLHETAQYSARFAEYRLLAASGHLLSYLGVRAPTGSTAYARETFDVPSFDSFEPRPRQEVPFNRPLNLTNYSN